MFTFFNFFYKKKTLNLKKNYFWQKYSFKHELIDCEHFEFFFFLFLVFFRSWTSSVDKVDDYIWKSLVRISYPSDKTLLVLLDKALYLMLVLDNDHLLSVEYEHGMLKHMIATL